jgi:uncharacterized protein (DUF2461 family)
MKNETKNISIISPLKTHNSKNFFSTKKDEFEQEN